MAHAAQAIQQGILAVNVKMDEIVRHGGPRSSAVSGLRTLYQIADSREIYTGAVTALVWQCCQCAGPAANGCSQL
jgi:hypothetical protein